MIDLSCVAFDATIDWLVRPDYRAFDAFVSIRRLRFEWYLFGARTSAGKMHTPRNMAQPSDRRLSAPQQEYGPLRMFCF